MCAGQPITTEGRYAVTISKYQKIKYTESKKYTMMMNTTLEQLRSLRLAGMATGLQEQLTQPGMTGMSFEERLALLVDREVHWRSDKRQARLLKAANLKYPQACIEDIDTRAGRGLERSAVMSLALGHWIESGHSVLITGLTGAGKTWLACALAIRLQARAHSALPAGASPGRRAAHPPRQWQLWQVAHRLGQNGCVAARRLGHGRHRQPDPRRFAGDH